MTATGKQFIPSANTKPQNKAGLIAVVVIAILSMMFCCCAPALSAAFSRTATPTVDLEAVKTKISKTIIAAANQTDQAKPTQTLTPTIAFTPTSTSTIGPSSTATDSPTPTLAPTNTTAPVPTEADTAIPEDTAVPPAGNCNPAYPDLCLTHEVDCSDLSAGNFRVLPPDPYRLDRDGDGLGCESN